MAAVIRADVFVAVRSSSKWANGTGVVYYLLHHGVRTTSSKFDKSVSVFPFMATTVYQIRAPPLQKTMTKNVEKSVTDI